MKLQPLHRARRFAEALWPARVSEGDLEWVSSILSNEEFVAFKRMTVRDRAHSLKVARSVEANISRLDPADDNRWVLEAALLHDVGKSAVRLGTYGRIAATLSGWVGGEDMADHWAERQGLTRRIGLYLKYPRLGADILRLAGSNPLVVTWSVEHHYEPQDWTVPPEAARLLSAADDGRL